MASRVVEVDPTQDARWDRFVEQQPLGWVTHLSGWRRVLEGSFDHIGAHFFAEVGDGEFRAALPVYEVRGGLRRTRLVSVPFGTLVHPLFTDPGDLATIMADVRRYGRERGVDLVEVRAMHEEAALPAEDAIVSRAFVMHSLSLDSPLEDIFGNLDRTCVRQRIRRAEKGGLQTVTVTTERQLREFFRLFVLTRRRIGLPPHPYRFLQAMWREFSPGGRLEVRLATKDGNAVAGILLLKFRERVSAEYMVSDEAWRELSPNHLLFWEAIRDAKSCGFRTFDFGRTDEQNRNLADFKRRWGAAAQVLPIYQFGATAKGRANLPRRAGRSGVLKAICRRMPAKVLERLGHVCYRYLT